MLRLKLNPQTPTHWLLSEVSDVASVSDPDFSGYTPFLRTGFVSQAVILKS